MLIDIFTLHYRKLLYNSYNIKSSGKLHTILHNKIDVTNKDQSLKLILNIWVF